MVQGCSRGRHSNEKPQEPLQAEVTTDKGQMKHTNGQEIIYQGPKSAEKLQRERPRYSSLRGILDKISDGKRNLEMEPHLVNSELSL